MMQFFFLALLFGRHQFWTTLKLWMFQFQHAVIFQSAFPKDILCPSGWMLKEFQLQWKEIPAFSRQQIMTVRNRKGSFAKRNKNASLPNDLKKWEATCNFNSTLRGKNILSILVSHYALRSIWRGKNYKQQFRSKKYDYSFVKSVK